MLNALEKTLAVPSFMRAPQWRWNLTLHSRAQPFETPTQFRRDDSLYESAQFYRNQCMNKDGYAYRRRTYPEMLMAHNLYTDVSETSLVTGGSRWRGLIDSLLLAGLGFDEFSSALGLDLPADAIRLYHDVFFDVRDYIHSEPAVYVNVLSVSDQDLGIDVNGSTVSPKKALELERNCVLRLFGYVWGPHALLEYFFSRARGQNRMHTQWVRASAVELLSQQALTSSMNRRNIYKEECVEIYKLAQKNWSIPAQEVSSVETEIRQRFLHQTVTLISDRLRTADRLRAERGLSREQAYAEVRL